MTVNLVDASGHPDFIAEVERVLGVLDGAVLVVSAVEDSVRERLGQGLHGWQVTDVAVTMTHAGYPPRQSHAHQGFDKSMSSTGHDVRGLTPLVLVEASRRAGSRVYEAHAPLPCRRPGGHPGRAAAPAVPAVPAAGRAAGHRDTRRRLCAGGDRARRPRARPRAAAAGTDARRGRGESAFDHYAPVTGATPPERPRTDHNPLNREEYLLNVTRRTADRSRRD